MKKIFATSFLILILGIPILSAQPSPCGEWKTSKQEGEYKVYVRECEDSPIKEFKILDLFPGNFDTLIKVMNDVNTTKHISRNCTEARLVKNLGNHENVNYFYFNLPLTLSDRDAVTKTKVMQTKTAYKIESETYAEGEVNVAPRKNVIRLKSVKTYYYFEKMPNGMIRMEYIGRADPNGWIPAWMINMMAQIEAQKMVEKLKSLVRK